MKYYFCLAEICPYTFPQLSAQFFVPLSNSVSMSMTMYNLKEIIDSIEFGIIIKFFNYKYVVRCNKTINGNRKIY